MKLWMHQDVLLAVVLQATFLAYLSMNMIF